MIKLIPLIAATLCLIAAPLQAEAAKNAPSDKDRLVLMPLRLTEDIQNMQGAMETSLVEGLQAKYTVFAGEDVAKKTREYFKKESAKQNCDETRCLQNIAIAFQAELIAVANVTKIEGGYLLALSIRDAMSNEAVYSKSISCEGCSAFQVVEKLKELSGSVTNVAPTAIAQTRAYQNDPETSLWDEVNKNNLQDDYGSYLKQYPNGKFSSLAKARIDKLQAQEKVALNTAMRGNSVESYEKYISEYPTGRYVPLAQNKITQLKKGPSVTAVKQNNDPKNSTLNSTSGNATLHNIDYVNHGGLIWMPVSIKGYNYDQAMALCSGAINSKTGWRLPTKDELLALYASGAMNDMGWALHNTWSSTARNNGTYYVVNLISGGVGSDNDKDIQYVTCVREASPTASEAVTVPKEKQKLQVETTKQNYVSQGGLTWMPVSFYKNWADANVFCANNKINGQSGWRLPTNDELIALFNSGAMKNQGWTLRNTWSSVRSDNNYHYIVNMLGGGLVSTVDSYDSYVTCVR